MTEQLGQSLVFSPITFPIELPHHSSSSSSVFGKPQQIIEFIQCSTNPPEISSPQTTTSPESIEASPTESPYKYCIREKRSRWRPTASQKQILENIWAENPYPQAPQKKEIVELLEGVTYKQVTSWFKHKREHSKARGFVPVRTSATKFTQDETSVLENAFLMNPYSRSKNLQELATALNVPLKKIQNWFKHKRSRLKLEKSKLSETARIHWEESEHNQHHTVFIPPPTKKAVPSSQQQQQQEDSDSSAGEDKYMFAVDTQNTTTNSLCDEEEERFKKTTNNDPCFSKAKFNKSETDKEFADLAAAIEPYENILFSHYVFRPLETPEHQILPEQERFSDHGQQS